MKQTWRQYVLLGALLWVLGLAIQIIALAAQTDPYMNLSWEALLSAVLIYPASILLVWAYTLRSDGGRRYPGYILVVSGGLCIAALWVFHNALTDLFMPRVWTPGMLLVNSSALIIAGVVYPGLKKALKRDLDKQGSTK